MPNVLLSTWWGLAVHAVVLLVPGYSKSRKIPTAPREVTSTSGKIVCSLHGGGWLCTRLFSRYLDFRNQERFLRYIVHTHVVSIWGWLYAAVLPAPGYSKSRKAFTFDLGHLALLLYYDVGAFLNSKAPPLRRRRWQNVLVASSDRIRASRYYPIRTRS